MKGRTLHRLELGDARLLDHLPEASVQLAVTSPPYPMIEMWDELFGRLNPGVGPALQRGEGQEAFALMHGELDRVWAQVARLLTPGGIACINVGDAARRLNGSFRLFPNHARILSACSALGLHVLPGILWRKPTNAPNKFVGSGMLPAGAYLTLEHEHILVLRKGPLRGFSGEAERRQRRRSAFFWEERNRWFSDLWELTGARQELGGGGGRPRSGAFPFELAYRLVNMFSVAGDTVLDPFAGSGTTMRAAMASGRHSLAVELDPALEPVIAAGFEGIVERSNRRIRERLLRHLEFVRGAGRPLKHVNRRYGFPVVTRQETELCFEPLQSLRRVGRGSWEVLYGEEGELFGPEALTEAWRQAPQEA